MVISGLLMTIMLGFVKVMRAEMSSMEVAFWRSAMTIPLILVVTRGRGLKVFKQKLILFRALSGFAAMLCFFYAAGGMPIGDLSLIYKLQPILIAVAAPLALGADERVDKRVWYSLVVGLAGCALIVGPDFAVGSWFAIAAVATAVFSAVAHLAVRALGATEQPLAVVFWFQFIIWVLSGVLLNVQALVEQGTLWVPLPGDHMWPYLIGCGLSATLGQFFMTLAYKLDRAAVVAAASYVAPIWAIGVDILFFDTLPTWWVIIGGVLVMAAGLSLILGSPRRRPLSTQKVAVPKPMA